MQTLRDAAKNEQHQSCSNSSLMRVTPLVIWACDISDLEVYRKIIIAETELTHSNPLVQDAAFVYCRAITYLMMNAEDANKHKKCFDYALSMSNKVVFKDEDVSAWLEFAKTKADE